MADPNEQAAKDLRTAANAYLNAFSGSDKEARAALQKVEEALREVRRLRFGEAASTIGTFFADIGKGVVTAQRQLDEASEQYVLDLLERRKEQDPEARGEVPGAAMFRIPRVSAELKLSLEKSGEEGWSVVFYSKGQETKELNQQSLQFEIVSVPMPPGYTEFLDRTAPRGGPPRGALAGGQRAVPGKVAPPHLAELPTALGLSGAPGGLEGARGAAGGGAPPHFRALPSGYESARQLPERAGGGRVHCPFVADEERRHEVREALSGLAKGMAPAQRRRVQRTLLPAWERAMIFAADEHCAFVVLVHEGKRPELILWQVVTQPASVVELYRMPAAARPTRELERLRELLIAVDRATRGAAARRR